MKIYTFLIIKKNKLLDNIIYNSLKYYLFLYRVLYLGKIKNKKKTIKKKTQKIVIFGSARSALNFSKREKKILSKYKIIFMNKNLIFWKYLNIWPDYYFLSDTPLKSNKAIKIFLDTYKKIIQTNFVAPTFLLENFYKFSLSKDLKSFFFKFKKKTYIKWASSLDDEMFSFHGSLTTLLNLISILKIGKKVLLVGFDMRDSTYFFEKNKLFIKYKDKNFKKKNSLHPNAEKINGKNIFSYWSILNKQLKKKNINIYCNNQNSLLIKNRLVKFKSISDF